MALSAVVSSILAEVVDDALAIARERKIGQQWFVVDEGSAHERHLEPISDPVALRSTVRGELSQTSFRKTYLRPPRMAELVDLCTGNVLRRLVGGVAVFLDEDEETSIAFTCRDSTKLYAREVMVSLPPRPQPTSRRLTANCDMMHSVKLLSVFERMLALNFSRVSQFLCGTDADALRALSHKLPSPRGTEVSQSAAKVFEITIDHVEYSAMHHSTGRWASQTSLIDETSTSLETSSSRGCTLIAELLRAQSPTAVACLESLGSRSAFCWQWQMVRLSSPVEALTLGAAIRSRITAKQHLMETGSWRLRMWLRPFAGCTNDDAGCRLQPRVGVHVHSFTGCESIIHFNSMTWSSGVAGATNLPRQALALNDLIPDSHRQSAEVRYKVM